MKLLCVLLLPLAGVLCACNHQSDKAEIMEEVFERDVTVPEESTFFGTVFIEEAAAFDATSDGDLWPSAWADDDNLYAANGDGKGFSLDSAFSDIVSNRVGGHPRDHSLRGQRLAGRDRISTVWGDTATYNRKPTGMLSVGGVLYLAVQDLNKIGPTYSMKLPPPPLFDQTIKAERGTGMRPHPCSKTTYLPP